jgi:hypothetical protein
LVFAFERSNGFEALVVLFALPENLKLIKHIISNYSKLGPLAMWVSGGRLELEGGGAGSHALANIKQAFPFFLIIN